MKHLAVMLWLVAGLLPARGLSPIDDDAPAAIRLTNPRTQRWQFGVVVRARGETTGIAATLPVPMPWPEQDVKVVVRIARTISANVARPSIKYFTSLPARTGCMVGVPPVSNQRL